LNWVPVARILKARGVKGEVWVEFLVDGLDGFEEGDALTLEADGVSRPARVERFFRYSKGAVLKLQEIRSREDADRATGSLLLLGEDAVPEPDASSFDLDAVLGYRMIDARRGEIGAVTDVFEGTEYWILRGEGPLGPFEVPAVHGLSVGFDDEARLVSMDLPDCWPGVDEPETGAKASPREEAGD